MDVVLIGATSQNYTFRQQKKYLTKVKKKKGNKSFFTQLMQCNPANFELLIYIFTEIPFNWLYETKWNIKNENNPEGSFSSHLQLNVVSLVCHRWFTVALPTRVHLAAMVSPVCQCPVATHLTKQKVKNQVEMRLMPACVSFVPELVQLVQCTSGCTNWPMYKTCSMTGEQWGLQNISMEGRISNCVRWIT